MTDEEKQEEKQEEIKEEQPEEKVEEEAQEESTEEKEEPKQEEVAAEQPAEQSQEQYGEGGDPRYDTLKVEEIKYGTNNFIEVARKKIDDTEFISLSKGYYTRRGTRRYKNGLGFPDQEDIKKFLIEKLGII